MPDAPRVSRAVIRRAAGRGDRRRENRRDRPACPCDRSPAGPAAQGHGAGAHLGQMRAPGEFVLVALARENLGGVGRVRSTCRGPRRRKGRESSGRENRFSDRVRSCRPFRQKRGRGQAPSRARALTPGGACAQIAAKEAPMPAKITYGVQHMLAEANAAVTDAERGRGARPARRATTYCSSICATRANWRARGASPAPSIARAACWNSGSTRPAPTPSRNSSRTRRFVFFCAGGLRSALVRRIWRRTWASRRSRMSRAGFPPGKRPERLTSRRADRRRRKGPVNVPDPVHRQQGLFLLVAAALAADARAGHSLRGAGHPALCGRLARKNAARGADRQSSGAARRRFRGVGFARHRRISGGKLSGQKHLAAKRRQTAPGRGRSAPRCIRVSRALRKDCPTNFRRDRRAAPLEIDQEARADLARIEAIFTKSEGRFLSAIFAPPTLFSRRW